MDCQNCINIDLPTPPQPFDISTYRNTSCMTLITNYANKRRKNLQAPPYQTNDAHNTNWHCRIKLDGTAYPQATSNEKRLARELAAQLALKSLLAGPDRREVLGCMPRYLGIFEQYLEENGIRDCMQWDGPKSDGPDHRKNWTCIVTMHGVQIASATTSSKHQTKEEAAKKAALGFHTWPCNEPIPVDERDDYSPTHFLSQRFHI